MDQVLQDFILALRRSGLRVSTAESVDALRAAELIGYGARQALKDGLAAALAKSLDDKEIFGSIFDGFFSGAEVYSGRAGPSASSRLDPAGADSPLTGLLLSGDSAGIAVSMRAAGRLAGVANIRFLTQKGMYIRRILTQMGWDCVTEDLRRLDRHSDEDSKLTARLEEARDALYWRVKGYVEQQLMLFASASMEEVVEQNLRDSSLSALEERDFERLDALIRKMVKRLNTLHSRRRRASKRGHVALKDTLKKSIAFQGLPFQMAWKAKKVERAEIIVICDVSRSMRTAVRFLLLFLYSLNQTLAKVRTFIFCSNLVETSELFADYPLEEALARIQAGAGLDIRLGLTDYGQALIDFKDRWFDRVTHKTTVIVLGDARNNYGDPRTDILKSIARRCKRLIWLNPESRFQWGTGDSEMKRYAPYCHSVRQCRSVQHLERAVDMLLKQPR
jgi:uncharacterized protein